MKNINLVEHCTACLACLNICPTKCITTITAELGHCKTKASDICIECGACLKVCPQITDVIEKKPMKAIAAWNADIKERTSSSSGGIATAIAENFIQGGVVYGCRFIYPFCFRHVRCTSIEDVQTLKGSKYVQSDITDIYNQITKDLDAGKKVLFISIPCQVAGINNYFKKKQENLYSIDLLCHGTPSVDMIKESLPKKKLLRRIENITFRDNLSYQTSLWKNNHKVWFRSANRDWFLKGFLKNLFSKDSCFSCKYAKHGRMGDISLGDFWGALPEALECDRTKGVSVCLVNSPKGAELMQNITDKVKTTEVSLEEELSGNLQLNQSAHHTWRTRLFRYTYKYLGYRMSVLLTMPDVILKNLLLK